LIIIKKIKKFSYLDVCKEKSSIFAVPNRETYFDSKLKKAGVAQLARAADL
jgi:hypothetical protein